MGRPKGSKNKQTSDESKEIEESGENDNVTTLPVVRVERFGDEAKPAKAAKQPKAEIAQLNDAQQQELMIQHQRSYNKALAAKKKADADLLQVCKLAKSELGKDAVADIKLFSRLETQEGDEQETSRIRRFIQLAQWAGAKIGEQLKLFGKEDGVPLGLRAYEAGKRAGIKGDKAKPPSEFGSGEQSDQWLSGWQDGQSELAGKTFKMPNFRDVAEQGDQVILDVNAGRPPSYEVIN